MDAGESLTEYSTPLPHLAFSSQFFDRLTISELANLDFPAIAPLGSIVGAAFKFHPDVPSSASATLIQPNEVIPHYADLKDVTRNIEDAFRKGMRSVFVEFYYLDISYAYVYHFSKLNLIRNASNLFEPSRKYRQLLSHLLGVQFSLSESELESFRNAPAMSHMSGFYSTQFRLYELACLLSENYLEEDVLNALLELSYFRQFQMSSLGSVNHSLILPTSFLTDARASFEAVPQFFTEEIDNIRRRLSDTSTVDAVAMPCHTNDHYTAFVYRPGSSIVEFGDSLHGAPPSDILPILQWIFGPTITEIAPGSIRMQGLGNGEGSCGIACHNFIERYTHVRPGLCFWSGDEAQRFRDAALEDLVRVHQLASASDEDPGQWTTMALPTTGEGQTDRPSLGVGYHDFNVYLPTAAHPIIKFRVNPRSSLSMSIQPALPQAVPLLSMLQASSPDSKTITVPLRPLTPTLPKTSVKRQYDEISPPRPVKEEANDNVIDLRTPSPPIKMENPVTTPRPAPKKARFDLASKNGKLVSVKQEFIGLSLDSPSPQRPVKPEPIPFILAPNNRVIEAAPGVVRLGSLFRTLDEARDAIYAQQERLGFLWKQAQSKTQNGRLKKMTYRCICYGQHNPSHCIDIDPSDHRNGKTNKTNCMAHINVNRLADSDLWHVTMVDWEHNHDRNIPEGAPIRRKPTKDQKEIISQLATSSSQTFSRGQIAAVMKAQGGGGLEPRQVSNVMNDARREGRQEVIRHGGDFNAILASLTEKVRSGEAFNYELKINEQTGVITGLWWQSPVQAAIARRWYDVLLNDNTYNRLNLPYPLNIGITIDGHGSSRNIWYALQAIEDVAHFTWVLQCHLKYVNDQQPDCFVSDRDRALISAVKTVMPLAEHFFCIHHLEGNIDMNLRRHIPSSDWPTFKDAFWTAYGAVSPTEFQRLWSEMTRLFPTAQAYLDEELYPCRGQWAWAFTAYKFTCGVRTSGRVEGENRINKFIGGPKKSAMQLFDGLNERTNEQRTNELVRARDSTRRQHPTSIERVFPGPLPLVRNHVGAFGLQVCFKQMQESVYYRTKVLQRPDGMRDWSQYALRVDEQQRYTWNGNEESRMINNFENDKSYISERWLIRLICDRGETIKHLFRVESLGGNTSHLVAILADDIYACDCCMGSNLGLPCRHYFQVLCSMPTLRFNLGCIRRRWYSDPDLDAGSLPMVTARENEPPLLMQHRPSDTAAPRITSNPLHATHNQPVLPSPTQTVPARTVFHEATAALRPATAGIQTREQLDDLIGDIADLLANREQELENEKIKEPASGRVPKGRPRDARLTGALEGRPRGGGARRTPKKSGRKCGICRMEGHTAPRCPLRLGDLP